MLSFALMHFANSACAWLYYNRLSLKNNFFWASHHMIRNYFGIEWYYYFAFLTWNAVARAGLLLFQPKCLVQTSNQPAPNKILLGLRQFCTEWSENLDMSYFEYLAPYVRCPAKKYFFGLSLLLNAKKNYPLWPSIKEWKVLIIGPQKMY